MKTIRGLTVFAALATTAISQESLSLLEEPDYVNTPRYLCVFFGEDDRDRVWLILDGDQFLYLDKDMDGKIDPKNEKFQVGSHPQFSSDHFVIPEVTNPSGKIVAETLTLTRYTRSGSDVKEDIVKVMLPEKLPQMVGWRKMFEPDLKKAKAIRFCSSVSPRHLRSKEISMSVEKAEIHLCLEAESRKGEYRGLVGIDAFPDKSIPIAIIHWPSEAKAENRVTSEVHLTKRC